MYGYRRGLGSIGYGDYMNACTGGVDTAQCGFDDTSCLAGAQNVVNACDQQYVTDPSSPHNNPNANTLPTQITSNSPIEQAELYAAGGAVNTEGNVIPIAAAPSSCFQQTMTGNWVCQDAAGNVTPAATPTAATSSAPPSSTPATVVSSSAPPASAAASYQSSAPPATSTPTTSTGFDLSSIPWWAWAAAAGAAFFAFNK